MIVFDLKCGTGHVFEAWFGSSTAYEEQRAGGLVACPMCGDADVGKAVMAPNIGAKGNRARDNGGGAQVPAPLSEHPPEVVKAAMAALAAAQAKALEGSEWVGAKFASKARAMHVGDEEQAPIHGQATRAEAEALIEEGVAIAPLPLPVAPPEVLN